MIGNRILNYKIISLLGEGGMGTVYKAFDVQLERYVAIKIISPKLVQNSTFLERFRNEAKNQAKLTHPNIVSVYGFLETPEAIGFVMEFVDGNTISQLLTEYGRLDLIYSLRVIQQVLIAIEYAHTSGYIHRDLKPSNIIIDRNGLVKVMDFGISKSLTENQNLTRVGSNIGTIHYMSPEQIKGLAPTPKTDLYSLGITLYEMISGKTPYNFNSDYEIYEAHLKMRPPKISSVLPMIPVEVDELILSAMNKSSSINFENAGQFRHSIENLIFHLPVLIDRQNIQGDINVKNPSKIHRSSNLIIAFTLVITMLVVGLSYLLIDKFILENKTSKDFSKNNDIQYLQSFGNFQSVWDKIETGIKEKIKSITYNAGTVILLGKNSVYTSDNLGLSWKQIYNTREVLNELTNSDENTFIIGDNGIFLIVDSENIIRNIKFPTNDNLVSIFVREKILTGTSSGTLFLSDKKRIKPSKITFPGKNSITSIFEMESNIFVGDLSGKMYRSSDGGNNWVVDTFNQGYIKKILFVNPFRGFFITSENSAYLTTDGGKNWNKFSLQNKSQINDIIFVNQKLGFICTSDGNILISGNAGEDWISEKISGDSLLKIFVSNNGLIFILTEKGNILKNKI